MSDEDRRRFQQVGGYDQFRRQFPDLLRKPAPLEQLYGPYIVTATKADRSEEIKQEGGGIYAFGPFATETEAQQFYSKVIAHPDWVAEEVPFLNKPEVFGTGDERL